METKTITSKASRLDDNANDRLKGVFNFRDKGNTKKAEKNLDITVKMAASMNIGQGSCNILYDDRKKPRIYVDMGFPGYGMENQAPPNLANRGPCIPEPESTVVILSHWDMDHYRLATFPRQSQSPQAAALAKKCFWIIPEQSIGPVAKNLFESLKCVKVYSVPINKPWGSIHKCNGSSRDRNGSGLVISVKLKVYNELMDEQFILFTGDAGWRRIPEQLKANLKGITAVHHGAKTHGAIRNIPAPPGGSGKIIYSYGRNNRYGHPKQEAINAYTTAGWTDRCDTATNGNVRIASVNPDEQPYDNMDNQHCTFQNLNQ